jgi:hypothetical protein
MFQRAAKQEGVAKGASGQFVERRQPEWRSSKNDKVPFLLGSARI